MKQFPLLDVKGFRKCQINAINNLDQSFADNRPRALVQMATGAGKTFTAITSAYRLLKYGKMKRIFGRYQRIRGTGRAGISCVYTK